jgi:hypothetical protein
MFCRLHIRNIAVVAGLVSSLGKKFSSLPPQVILKTIATYAADWGILKIVFVFQISQKYEDQNLKTYSC